MGSPDPTSLLEQGQLEVVVQDHGVGTSPRMETPDSLGSLGHSLTTKTS